MNKGWFIWQGGTSYNCTIITISPWHFHMKKYIKMGKICARLLAYCIYPTGKTNKRSDDA